MYEEKLWQIALWVTILFAALGGVIISFLFLYQRKKFRHRQEIIQLEEAFTQEMLHSKVEIQEQTLRHVASEIHDNFNPTLSFINLSLADVSPHVALPGKAVFNEAKDTVKALMADMKALSISLNTDHISRIGFYKALEKYLDRLTRTGLFKITVTQTGDEYRLSPNKEIILFRMCQEVINNIVKHAEADTIKIQISYTPETLTIEIYDNGKGFDLNEITDNPDKQDSTGLRSLQHRAAAISASLHISSTPGAGTTISIALNQS
jgi:signal transduction histidine kinase